MTEEALVATFETPLVLAAPRIMKKRRTSRVMSLSCLAMSISPPLEDAKLSLAADSGVCALDCHCSDVLFGVATDP